MREDHQKISSSEILNNVYDILKDLNFFFVKDLTHFELLRYGSYKSL